MEDQHTVLLSLKEDKDAAFFAVFDGHGGLYMFMNVTYVRGENRKGLT